MSVDLGPTSLDWLAHRPGVISPTHQEERARFLTDVIVDMGYCSREAVESAVRESRTAGKLPTALLVERGELTTYELARAISERNGLPFIDLPLFALEPQAQLLIDRSAAERYRAVPIALAPDGSLVVALADPLDALAVSDIATITKSALLPTVADAEEIDALVERMPDAPPPSLAIFEELSDPSAVAEEPELRAEAPAAAPEPSAVQPPAQAALSSDLQDRLLATVAGALDNATAGELSRMEAELARAEERADQAEAQAAAAVQRAAALEGRVERAEGRAREAEALVQEACDQRDRLSDALSAMNAAVSRRLDDAPPR